MMEGPYIESIWRCGNGEFAAESTAFAAIGIAWPDGDYVAPSVGFGANQCRKADGCRFVHSAADDHIRDAKVCNLFDAKDTPSP